MSRRPHSRRKKMDLLQTILDEEESDQNRRARIGLSPPRHSDRLLNQKYQELQELLLNQYIQTQALLQQQFLTVQQTSATMQDSEPHRFHSSDDDYGDRLRHRRVKSAKSHRRFREEPRRPMSAPRSEHHHHRKAPQAGNASYSDDFEDTDDQVDDAVLLRTYPESSPRRHSSSCSSSVDSQSDVESDWEDGGSHADKRVSFSGVVDGRSRDSDSINNSRERKGILKYSSPRRKIMYTYPGYEEKYRSEEPSDDIRHATALLSMLHLPATRLGFHNYVPVVDQSRRRAVKPQRRKLKRKSSAPPPISLSTPPQVSPRSSTSSRSPREIKVTDNHLGKSNNPDLLKWLRKKNSMIRKQKRENRKKERETKKVEQEEMEKKVERFVEAEELYDKWLHKKSKETLLVRREEKKRKEYWKELREQERIEREKKLKELKEKQKAAAAMNKKKKKSESKAKPSKEEDGNKEKASSEKENEVKKDEAEKTEKSNSDATSQKQKKKGKNKIHPVLTGTARRSKTVRDPDGTLASNNDYVYNIPGRPKSATQSNKPSLSRFQPKRKTNPMSQMSYDEWVKHKRKEQNRKKLAEEVKQAKDAWSDPTLENIIPKLAKERIEKVTTSKLKVDTGLKKSPRDSRSPSPDKGIQSPSQNTQSKAGENDTTDNGNAKNHMWRLNGESGAEHQPRPPSSKARPGSANGKASTRFGSTNGKSSTKAGSANGKASTRPGSANGKSPTPPLSQRPGSGGKETKQKIAETERPEPQGCEIPSEQSQTNSAEENDNQQPENVSVNTDKPLNSENAGNQSDTKDQPEKSESPSGANMSSKTETQNDSQNDASDESIPDVTKDASDASDVTKEDDNKDKTEGSDSKPESSGVSEEDNKKQTKVKFNLDENIQIPPPETEADKKLDDVYKTANDIDDFLRKDSNGEQSNGAVDSQNGDQESTGVFMTETET